MPEYISDINLTTKILTEENLQMKKLSGYEEKKGIKLHSILKVLTSIEEFKNAEEKEFENLVYGLKKLEDEGSATSYTKVVKSLIKLVDVKDMTLSTELTEIGLKVFRKIIEIENIDNVLPAAEWESNDWSKYEGVILGRQNILCELGVVDMICNMISFAPKRQLKRQALLVAIALLIGGNKIVQNEFLNTMRKDSQNEFLLAIKGVILKNFEIVKKFMNEINKDIDEIYKQKKESTIPTTETSLFPQQKIDKTSDKNVNNFLPVNSSEHLSEDTEEALYNLIKSYRLLQLLCEGHNLNLQNHLRQQTNESGLLLGKSYNFIQSGCLIFGSYIKYANIYSINLGDQLLDFLIESVQGPCPENQVTMSQSKIIFFAMDFVSMFKTLVDFELKGFTNEILQDGINDLTTKSMKLLISMIEGSANQEVISEMIDNLDFSFLISKLMNIYKEFLSKSLKLPISTPISDIIDELQASSFDENTLESFDIYILLKTLADAKPNEMSDYMSATSTTLGLEEKKTLDFYEANLGSIEIKFNDKLIKVYFPILPTCRFLSEDSKKSFLETVNRETPNDKLTVSQILFFNI